jgi:hypothetical protein
VIDLQRELEADFRPSDAELSRQVYAVVESDGYYLLRGDDETIYGPAVTPTELVIEAEQAGWEIVNADEVAEWHRPDDEYGAWDV